MPSICTGFCLIMLLGAPVVAGQYDKYLWETPRIHNIDRARTASLTEELSREVQRVVETGPLAPLRCSYADIPGEADWLYYERGRIVTTLAYAYPHVNPQQQRTIQAYVRQVLAGKADAPWEDGLKGKLEGAPRALDVRFVSSCAVPESARKNVISRKTGVSSENCGDCCWLWTYETDI
jgi:hypothetical protein